MQVGPPSQLFPLDNKLPPGGDVLSAAAPAVANWWYDSAQQIVIALMARPVDAVPPNLSEQVEYRVSSSVTTTHHKSSSSHDDTGALSASDPNNSRRVPTIVPPQRILKFRLPPTLATQRNHRVGSEKDGPAAQSSNVARRVPVDVKLSLDQRLLVIQFTVTLIRIVPLERPDEESFSRTPQNHWTIELSAGVIEPVSTGPFSVPTCGNSSSAQSSLEESENKDNVVESSNKRGFEILENGIIFSDHGGNSQDLMIVTTKAVLCYKISLRRNQMAVTHAFPQSPPACAVWYDPPTRSVVIGSMGPAVDCSNVMMGKDYNHNKGGSDRSSSKKSSITTVQIRTFLLRFPNLEKPKRGRSLRLELPPPRRLPLYAAGRSRIFRIVSSPSKTQPVSEVVAEPSIISPTELWVMNIYGDAYILEMETSSSRGLQLVLHRVDPAIGVVYFKTYTIENFHPIQINKENVLLSVLDNILFVSFCDTTLFLDIMDSDNTYYLKKSSDVVAAMVANQRASFLPPGLLLDRSGHGQVFPIALGIEKLANSLPWAPSIVTFFLRRQNSQRSYEIAVSKLEMLLTRTVSSGATAQHLHDTRRTLDLVVQMYAGDKVTNLGRDWNVGISLLYDSAFLPSNAVFRHHDADVMITSSYIGRMAKRPLPSVNILYQSEILANILIPNAKRALKDGVHSLLEQVLDFAISLLGALDRCQTPSSPALECVIFSILWHLGYEQELARFLETRCRSDYDWKRSGLLDKFAWDAGNIVLSNLLVAIASEIPFGILRAKTTGRLRKTDGRIAKPYHSKAHRLIKKWSSRLLLLRVTNVELVASHLLKEGEILDVMNFYLRCECVSKKNSRPDRQKEHASKVTRIDLANLNNSSRIDAENLVHVALSRCRHSENHLGNRCRVQSCLKAFLSLRDPDWIARGEWDKALLDDNSCMDKHRSVSHEDSRFGCDYCESAIAAQGNSMSWSTRRRNSIEYTKTGL